MSVSMGNTIRWLKREISLIDPQVSEERAEADLCEAIDNFTRERITVADQVIVLTAANKIRDGSDILTFAKSNVVQQTLVEAHRQGVRFEVIFLDSRPCLKERTWQKLL